MAKDIDLLPFKNIPLWKKISYDQRVVGDDYYLPDNLSLTESFPCRYPLRYKLITKRQVPSSCADYWRFVKAHAGSFLSIIYAGEYPRNPASMFGHLLLRLKKNKEGTLFDTTIAFQANTNPEDNVLVYSWKGMSGQYPGRYELRQYHMVKGLYTQKEGRGLWEYELNVSKVAQQRIVDHLWEMGQQNALPYYFFDENCAHYILSLLEVADQSVSLVDREDYFLVYPIENLKLVLESPLYQKGRITRQSSPMEQMNQMRLSTSDLDELQKAIANPKKLRGVSTAALDALLIKYKREFYADTNSNEHYYLALTERANRQEKPPILNSKAGLGPEVSHGKSKFFVGPGSVDKRPAIMAEVFWGHHGLADYHGTRVLDTAIDFGGVSLSAIQGEIELKRMTLVDITSLTAMSVLDNSLSWRGRSYVENKKLTTAVSMGPYFKMNNLGVSIQLSGQSLFGKGLSRAYVAFETLLLAYWDKAAFYINLTQKLGSRSKRRVLESIGNYFVSQHYAISLRSSFRDSKENEFFLGLQAHF